MSDSMTPKEIVEKLDQYIIGQDAAKRAVAVAMRNRWRRQQIEPEMRKEVMPRNILMIGPTGVGKTEIARRMADLVNAPFVKIEASKYTEVGYHGRDVESMVRDLVKVSFNEIRAKEIERVADVADGHAVETILDYLLPNNDAKNKSGADEKTRGRKKKVDVEREQADARIERTRAKIREKVLKGEMDDREIEIVANANPSVTGVFGAVDGDEMMGMEMQDMLSRILPSRRKSRRVKVAEARRIFKQEEAEKLIDEEAVNKTAIERAEQDGIIFIDEIDKVIGADKGGGPDVSREGVQRDLLPIVEGCTVSSKYGSVKTDHILFIAAGAFHGKKPSDLIPELQGRLPIRVELKPLTRDDFTQILTHPKNALTRQYKLLMQTEGIEVEFQTEALAAIAELTEKVNQTTDDIGARRLHTVMEKLFEEVSFNAPEWRDRKVVVDPQMVRDRLAEISKDEDLSRFIL
ncbi:ATP-dependent protease ATPase subunit HslU [Planctomycetales bacterium]|nr:ATP-dependent protease ATPase subunit HslU [Planctomycetales bacterium]GHS99183.1 ATP-dependent protease ATPase subunit HslU [Planctomycetales bacterium]GHT03611.1 ATP-dependent protease ATPase subunit HslU [Planctomycetales bacterium]